MSWQVYLNFGCQRTRLGRGRESLTIFILDQAIEQDTGHGDGTTWEVGVVVHALTNFNSRGRIDVAGQEREDVVLV